jgi:hypothetical protein
MGKTATVEKTEIEPLDSRIATVLGSDEEFSSEFLQALYDELDEAVGVADQTARECRARSIDPLVRDGIAERGRAEDQEFISHRLKAAASPLREKHGQALIREHSAQWHHTATVVELVVKEFGRTRKTGQRRIARIQRSKESRYRSGFKNPDLRSARGSDQLDRACWRSA